MLKQKKAAGFGPAAFFLFIPWISFIGNHHLEDGEKLRIALSPNCTEIDQSQVYDVTLATSDWSRRKGLSERKEALKPKEGMLFIYESPQQSQFWMKKTYIPLDIAFINSHGLISQVEHMAVEDDPENPKKLYTSRELSIAGLEVAQGRLPKLDSVKFLKLCVLAGKKFF